MWIRTQRGSLVNLRHATRVWISRNPEGEIAVWAEFAVPHYLDAAGTETYAERVARCETVEDAEQVLRDIENGLAARREFWGMTSYPANENAPAEAEA